MPLLGTNIAAPLSEKCVTPKPEFCMLKMMLLAGCGGFVGTALRFLTGKLCAQIHLGGFPLGTFAVNIVGSFLIGVLFGLAEERGLQKVCDVEETV
jgi:fluoride ion exporter CrcB/FEX